MGAAGSNNNAPPSAPLREPSEEALIYGTQESCCPEYTNEYTRQRTKTSTFNVGEEPQSQVKFKANIYCSWEEFKRWDSREKNTLPWILIQSFNHCNTFRRVRVLTRPLRAKNRGIVHRRLACRTCRLLVVRPWWVLLLHPIIKCF